MPRCVQCARDTPQPLLRFILLFYRADRQMIDYNAGLWSGVLYINTSMLCGHKKHLCSQNDSLILAFCRPGLSNENIVVSM